tara:strand:- start:4699 stop:5622 length:924 start_codon:yes stop_codon:yes gene_type:complete
MKSFYLQQFEEKFKELINELSVKFPDKIEIEVYKRSLNKLDYIKIVKHFAEQLQPYSNLVSESNDDLFKIEKLEFIDQISFNEIWESDLGETDRKSIWQYIQILYLLSNLIIDNSISENKTNIKDNKQCDIENGENSECTNSNESVSTNNEIPNIDGDFSKSQETINKMIETMKTNISNTDKEQLDINNISKEQIENATNEVKNRFQSSDNDNNIMGDMITEINKELNNMVDNKDDSNNNDNNSEFNPQLDMMSKMLNIDSKGLGGIMNIANRVSQKFQDRVESGDLNPNDLMQSAQSMLMGMQNMK